MRCSFMKKYLLSLLTTCLSIIVSLLFITTLYYFNLLNHTTYNILKIILLILSLFINSFILGKSTHQKGYLEGIKLSSPIIIIFLITTLLTNNFKFTIIIYYIIILIASSLGSMIGISTKKEL